MHARTLPVSLLTVLLSSPGVFAGGRPLVLVMDGAGDLRGCSTAIATTARADRSPVDVEVFPWSHGYREIRKDQTDSAHARRQGLVLATRVRAARAAQPTRPIILVSHSAGCAVALAAADHLPAGSVERSILLAPSVSARYDLRPTLRASARGVDVFCSRRDVWALGVAMRLVGTADEFHDAEAAGRFGFRPTAAGPADVELYRKLRHHFWDRADRATGHDGGHHGTHAPDFLRVNVFPLFAGD